MFAAMWGGEKGWRLALTRTLASQGSPVGLVLTAHFWAQGSTPMSFVFFFSVT